MTMMYSYVVDHDNGVAPNPSRGLCTLAKCKFSKSGKRNVVEMAEVGDWIIGTGGSAGLARGESAGRGKLIYAMRVEEKVPLAAYCRKYAGKRIDADHEPVVDGRFALLSRHFYYFGRNALPIPQRFLDHPLEKKGPGYRRDFSESFIKEFTGWLDKSFKVRAYAPPCKPSELLATRRCSPKRKPSERVTTSRCAPMPRRKSC